MSNSIAERNENYKELVESKVLLTERLVGSIQETYENLFETNSEEHELRLAVKDYSETLIHVNQLHDLMHEEDFYEPAETVSYLFADLVDTQSKYSSEVREEIGFTPVDLFLEYQNRE